MSARPDVARLSPEDLDLLISRSLDGDLNPEEQRELEIVLAADPEAARRREELAALVESVRNLPAPDPPFALATRVNSQVSERTSSVGSFTHRFGVYLPPGVVGGAIALLVALVIGGAFFTRLPVPLDQAEPKPTGPVQVFFSPGEPQAQPQQPDANAPRQEPKTAAKAAPAPALQADARRAEAPAPSRQLELKKEATVASAESAAGAPAEAAAEPRARDAHPPAALAAQAPALAEAPRAAAEKDRLGVKQLSLTWSVEIQGPGRSAWRLKRAPEAPPSAPVHVTVRLSLDPSGQVISVRPAAGEALTKEVERFARGLVFEPATESPPSLIEIEIGTR